MNFNIKTRHTAFLLSLCLLPASAIAALDRSDIACESQNHVLLANNMEATDLPFKGTLTLERFYTLTDKDLGIVNIDITDRTQLRILEGKSARWHESRMVVYRQPCGAEYRRILASKPGGLPLAITPCSLEMETSDGYEPKFEYSHLSKDGKYLAVESRIRGSSDYRVIVVDVSSKSIVNEFDQHIEPNWFPDARLLMASTLSGMSIWDPETDKLSVYAPGIYNGLIRNPIPSPSGKLIAFEFNQQIWVANSDGSNPCSVVIGDRQFRHPAWSPDEKYFAFLGLRENFSEYYDKAIYFTELATGRNFKMDLSNPEENKSMVYLGPVSWH